MPERTSGSFVAVGAASPTAPPDRYVRAELPHRGSGIPYPHIPFPMRGLTIRAQRMSIPSFGTHRCRSGGARGISGRRGYGGLTDPDTVPEAPEHPVTQPGDLWVLGNHRLLCGDATVPTNVERVLEGGVADMAFTDPPYNVNYHQPSSHPRRAGRTIANDNLGPAFEEFLLHACRNLVKATGGAIYISMSSSELDTLRRAFVEAGGHWSTFLIWAKNTFTLGRSDYHRQYEPILYGWREGSAHYWCGARDQGDVWFVNKHISNDLHPTQKPVELIERAIRNSSRRKDAVLDVFGGSGTTLIACEKTGRRARVMEINPAYVDVAVMRWQEFTGRDAVLDGGGAVFTEIRQTRVPVSFYTDQEAIGSPASEIRDRTACREPVCPKVPRLGPGG